MDETLAPIPDDDYEKMGSLIESFVDSYERNQDKPLDEWLTEKLQEELPEEEPERIRTMANDVIESVRILEDNKVSLNESLSNGRSKESWFAEQIKIATSGMSAEETVNYLNGLDKAVRTANESMIKTLISKNTGDISQNPSLHGYIAECEHVSSFNLKAEATGSPYRAMIIEHEGEAFTKNGVDIVIIDKRTGSNKAVRRYQSKYCQTPEKTEAAFTSDGRQYNGQQSLVPSEQAENMSRKCTDHIEAPDGTCSEPLSYKRARDLQKEAQSGKWNEKNWNSYKTKDIAIGIGKNARNAAILGAAIGAGVEVADKLAKGEKVDGKEVAKKAIESGADFGVKAAITGALKAGAEKGVIKCIPKGTPAGSIANVVFVGVENVKILIKYGKGELTRQQALEKMEETTVSALAGFAAMAKGAAVGAKIGTPLGPIGIAVGGFIGGTVAYIAGSGLGTLAVKARRKLCEWAKKPALKIVEKTKSFFKKSSEREGSGIQSFFGSLKVRFS